MVRRWARMTKPEEKRQPGGRAPQNRVQESAASPIGMRVVLGLGLLLAGFLLWQVRDLVPFWAAASVSVNVEFATTSERDDARVTRAFETALQTVAADATLEPLPNQTRVRHTRLTVRASSSAEAIAQATAMAEAIAAAFSGEGEGTLSVDVRRRTTPVPDRATSLLGDALRIGAGVAGILGLALIALGWFRFQAGPDRLPTQFWWAAGGGVALALAPFVLPGEITISLMIMAIPILVAGVILWKTMQVRHAASWPSTRARIIKSAPRALHRRGVGEVTQIVSVADIEYEFSLGDRVIRGTRIGIGEIADGSVEETLNRYPVGATVPVYYDPKNPQETLLERDPPLPVIWLYLIAAAFFIAGLAILAVFANGTAILENLEGYFPEGAFLPGMAFFALAGLMLLAMLRVARRQVAEASGWKVTGGRIVSSTLEHYRAPIGRGRGGGYATFYEPVVEYSYRVNGREYHSTQLSFGGRVAGSEELAAAKAAQYAAGSEVLVHYDPENPSNAVLDLKVAYAAPFLVIALVFLGLAVFFSGAFR
jgi:hypothetical protein